MVQIERERFQNTLKSVMGLCNRLNDGLDDDMRIQVLTSCQEAVITLGEKLESNNNPIDMRSMEELQIIKKLEAFCEQVYQCSQECTQKRIVTMKELIAEVSIALDSIPRTYRVAFLPYKVAMWDSLESIWKCFAADERCETTVLPIPYFEANRKLNKWDTCYEGDRYPDDVPVVYFQDYLLGDKQPDIVFVHNPFDQHNHVSMVHPAYHSQELKKHCKKLVYVPYYVNPGYLSDNYNELPLLFRSDYLVFQSERMKESCKKYPYYNRVLPFGSPMFDKVLRLYKEGVNPPEEWGIDGCTKTKIMLNTTLTDFLESNEKILEKLYRFFEVVAKRDDLVIIWRPHPLMEGTVKAMRPQFIEKYQELIDFFLENHIGVFDRTGDVSRAVVATDAYVGSHYSSVIGLFEVCNKPVFRFDSQKIYSPELFPNRKRASANDVFKMNGEFDFFGSYESEEYMFEDFVEDLIGGGLTEVLKRQMEAESDIASNLDGTCGEKVHKFLMNELMKQSG